MFTKENNTNKNDIYLKKIICDETQKINIKKIIIISID